MTRGIGLADLLAGLPDGIRVGAALLTQLGDAWFLVAVTVAVWVVDRRRSICRERSDPVAVIALVIGAYGLTALLKAAFGLPRPPIGPPTGPDWIGPVGQTAVAWLAHADGPGFPSGHALVSTVAYGTLAWRLRLWTPRQRALLAAALVSVIATTRLVLGVHYLVDVLAGVAVGAILLVAIERVRVGPGALVGTASLIAALGALVTLDARLAAAAVLPIGGWALATRLDHSRDR